MKFMTFVHQGRRRIGVAVDDYVIDLRAAYNFGRGTRQLTAVPELARALLPDDLVGFIHNGPEAMAAVEVALQATDDLVRRLGADSLFIGAQDRDDLCGVPGHGFGSGSPERLAYRLDEIEFAPPLVRPGKVIGIGLNYRDHAEETGKAVPQRPMFFNKFATSLIGHRQSILHPGGGITEQVDFEAELAVVIGRGGRFISKERAFEHVFGYTIMNDVSARDLQYSDGQFVRGKALDTFGPIGPWIVTKDVLPDPQTLAVSLHLNRERMQNGHTGDMIFAVDELIAALSELMTLEPGDVIMTGTPVGVGVARTPRLFLQPRDVVEISIDGIGNLVNDVRSPIVE